MTGLREYIAVDTLLTPIDCTDSLTRFDRSLGAAVCIDFNCIWIDKPSHAKLMCVFGAEINTEATAVAVFVYTHAKRCQNKQSDWEALNGITHTDALGWNIEFQIIHSFWCGFVECMCEAERRHGGAHFAETMTIYVNWKELCNGWCAQYRTVHW